MLAVIRRQRLDDRIAQLAVLLRQHLEDRTHRAVERWPMPAGVHRRLQRRILRGHLVQHRMDGLVHRNVDQAPGEGVVEDALLLARTSELAQDGGTLGIVRDRRQVETHLATLHIAIDVPVGGEAVKAEIHIQCAGHVLQHAVSDPGQATHPRRQFLQPGLDLVVGIRNGLRVSEIYRLTLGTLEPVNAVGTLPLQIWALCELGLALLGDGAAHLGGDVHRVDRRSGGATLKLRFKCYQFLFRARTRVAP